MPIIASKSSETSRHPNPISSGAVPQEKMSFYDANGYVVLDDILPHAECDLVLAKFEEHADKDFSSIMNLDRQEPKIREIMKYPALVAPMEILHGAELVGCQTFFLFKRVGTPYAAQAWNPHQDNSYPRAKPGAYITANIPLADQDPENGGMFIYPGSHRLGLLPFEPFTGHQEKPGSNPGNCVKVPPEFEDKKVDIRLKKGSALILNGNVIHGSYPNRSPDRSRPFLLMTYITKGEDFIAGIKAQRGRFPLR